MSKDGGLDDAVARAKERARVAALEAERLARAREEKQRAYDREMEPVLRKARRTLLSAARRVGQFLLVAVIGLGGVLGVDLLVGRFWPFEFPGGLWGGLLFAVAVFAVSAYGLPRAVNGGLERLLRRRSGVLPEVRAWVASLTALAVVVALPMIIVRLTNGGEKPLSRVALDPAVDVILVERRGIARGDTGFPPVPDEIAWDVRYSLVELDVRGRTHVRVSGIQRPLSGVLPSGRSDATLRLRSHAQRAIVLNVDAIEPIVSDPTRLAPRPQGASRATWNRVVSGLNLRAPVFALLRPSSRRRVDGWNKWAADRGGGAFEYTEIGTQTVVDTARRVATEPPILVLDRALAWRYRPHLRFDKRERYDWPVDVDWLLSSGTARMCRHGVTSPCVRICSSAQLDGSYDYLSLGIVRPRNLAETAHIFGPPGVPSSGEDCPQEPAAEAPPGSLEVPTGVGALPPSGPPPPPGPPPGDPPSDLPPRASGPTSTYYFHVHRQLSNRRIYVDYWWYVPYNPTPVFEDILCAPALNLQGLTCFDHESDWEGVTVVLRRTGRRLSPEAVHFAQHDSVVTYARRDVEWRDDHPAVYVARGSHASYPSACSDNCSQVAHDRREGSHGGTAEWANNDDRNCSGICLKPLPVRRNGHPALWNAFPGRWGVYQCILKTFCDGGPPPKSPSLQDRYRRPWHSNERAQ